MQSKPDKCKGCPLYGDGTGFVPDRLNDQAEVMIYTSSPEKFEQTEQKLMDSTFLPVAGLNRESISHGRAIRCHHRSALPPLKSVTVKNALEHCHRAHFKMPEKTKLIVATGEYAMHAMTQQGAEKHNTLSDWRGYVLPFEPIGTPRSTQVRVWHPSDSDAGEPAVLVTYNLTFIFRDPTAGLVTKLDWAKIAKILKGVWPKRLPEIEAGPPQTWPIICAFDTEFIPKPRDNRFLMYSLYDGKHLRVSDVLEPGVLMTEFVEPYRVIMHNGLADIPFLDQMLSRYKIEDTMHAHSVLWSDLDHDLGFLGSLYSPINRWKHLDRINPMEYSAADAYVTWHVWKALDAELERDPQSRHIYQNIQLKLIPIIRAAQEHGVKVNHAEAERAYMKRQVIIDDLNAQAQAMLGWPINVGSNQQAAHQLYEVEGLLNLIQKESK